MLKCFASGLLLLAAGSAAAQPAQVEQSVWDPSGETPRPKAVDIGVPRSAGTMALSSLKAFAPDGFDNGALYQSPDGKVFANVYIYRPGYADPSYTMLMTGLAIEARFAGARPSEEELVAVTGIPALHRRSYSGGMVQVEGGGTGEVATIAGALRAGDWIVKLRATGPAPRRDEVIAGFDALVAGLRFGSTARPVPSALDTLGQCPDHGDGKPAALAKQGPTALQMLVLAAVNPVDPAKPARGRKLCEVARQSGNGGMTLILSEENLAYPTIMLMGDAGNAIVTVPAVSNVSGWGLASSARDQAMMFGPFDRAPTAAQLLAIVSGGNIAWAGQAISRLTRDAEGKFNIEIAKP